MTTIRSFKGRLALPFSEARFLERWSLSLIWLMCRCTRALVGLRDVGRATVLAGDERRAGAATLAAPFEAGLALLVTSSALTNWSFRMLCHPRTPPCLAIWAKSL